MCWQGPRREKATAADRYTLELGQPMTSGQNGLEVTGGTGPAPAPSPQEVLRVTRSLKVPAPWCNKCGAGRLLGQIGSVSWERCVWRRSNWAATICKASLSRSPLGPLLHKITFSAAILNARDSHKWSIYHHILISQRRYIGMMRMPCSWGLLVVLGCHFGVTVCQDWEPAHGFAILLSFFHMEGCQDLGPFCSVMLCRLPEGPALGIPPHTHTHPR